MNKLHISFTLLFLLYLLSYSKMQINWQTKVNINREERLYDICYSLNESCFVTCGFTKPSDRLPFDALVLKVNHVGDTLWTKVLGGESYDIAYSVISSSSNEYYIGGTTRSIDPQGNAWFFKLDKDGELIWSKIYGGDLLDCIYSVIKINDDEYLLCGETSSYGNGGSDAWIIKTNSFGDTLWSKTYGGIGNDCAKCIINSPDGGFVFCGYTESESSSAGVGELDVLLAKIDSHGDIIWSKSYGGENYNDVAYSITATNDNGFIISASTDYNSIPWLIKVDEHGDTVWTKTIGDHNHLIYDGIQQKDSSYLFCGKTSDGKYGGSDGWLIKTDKFGDTIWTDFIGDIGSDEMVKIISIPESRVALCGYTSSLSSTKMDAIVVNMDIPETSVFKANNKKVKSFNISYYNLNGDVKIDFLHENSTDIIIDIYNSLGRKIGTIVKRNELNTDVIWNTKDLSTGLYFFRINTPNDSYSRKILIKK